MDFLVLYAIARWFGRLNIILALVAAALFACRRINKHVFANKNATLKKVIPWLSKMHPYIGISLVISAFIHGEAALGTIFRVHTGPMAWGIVGLMMVVALVGKKYQIKHWLQVHRSLAILLIIAILVHRVALNLL